ncbi:MAG: antibiotic biosynthesis monooxygenase [Thermoleophilia bacterium]|nr:antibiotic biosynthesis monooxygenase [Thermoleophilia bacterium]
MAYVSLSRLRVPAEHADQLVTAFRHRAGLVDAWDGFLGLEVWHSDRDPGELIMVTRWRDRDTFRAYMRSDDHQASHARIDPELDAVIQLERLEHVRTYEVVAR